MFCLTISSIFGRIFPYGDIQYTRIKSFCGIIFYESQYEVVWASSNGFLIKTYGGLHKMSKRIFSFYERLFVKAHLRQVEKVSKQNP